MTGPMLDVVAVFCPSCGRAQIHRVEDAPEKPQPCWWCHRGIKLERTSRCAPAPIDTPATISPGGAP